MKIAIYFGWANGNIGDLAITPGLIRILRSRFPQAEIHLISIYPPGSSDLQAFCDYMAHTCPDCRIWPNPLGIWEDGLDEMGIWLKTATISAKPAAYLRRLAQHHPEFCSLFLTTDLLILNSGMMLSYNRLGQSSALSYLVSLWHPLILALKLGVPTVTWGQSFGPFDAPADELLSQILPHSLAVTTRETTSLQLIRQLGVSSEQSWFGPDTTVYFDMKENQWADVFLEKYLLQPQRFAVNIIRTCGWWGKVIPPQRSRQQMERIALMVNHWVRSTGIKVLLAPEAVEELKQSRQYLWPLLEPDVRKNCILLEEFWTPQQAKAVYQHAYALSSMELHSIFLAVPEHIPVIHPYFDEMGPKTNAMKDFGLEDYMYHVDSASPESIQKILQTIDNDRPSVCRQVQQGADKFIQAVETGMDEIARRYHNLPTPALTPF